MARKPSTTRRRLTLKDVKHVDFMPSDFIQEIALHPEWTAQDIGCYFTICLYLYAQGGRIEFDFDRLAMICRLNRTEFESSWQKIKHKFNRKSTEILQKRVQKELRSALQRMQVAYIAGVKGAEKRWGGYSDPNSPPNGVAIAKTKRNENENYTNNNTKKGLNTCTSIGQNTKAAQKQISQKFPSHSATLRFAENLEKILPPITKSDRTAYVNMIRWLDNEIKNNHYDENVFEEIVGYAKQAKTGKSRNPIAVFFDMLKREIGYGRGKA